MLGRRLLSQTRPTRIALVILASVSDLLDGWLARRRRPSALGALLDPIADKTFVLAALSTFILDGAISTLEYFIILSRDFATAIGFVVAWRTPGLNPRNFKARLSGKVVTVLQLAVLVTLLLSGGAPDSLIWVVGVASIWAITDYSMVLARERGQWIGEG